MPASRHPEPGRILDGGEGSAFLPAFPASSLSKPLFRFFFFRADRPSPLVHAGASLAGNDSSDDSATGSIAWSIASGIFFGLLLVFILFFAAISIRRSVSASFATGMIATAIDVRHILHRFAFHTAITAVLRRRAGARRMRAFSRFPFSHSHSTSSPSKRLLFDAEVSCAEPLYSRGIIDICMRKVIACRERFAEGLRTWSNVRLNLCFRPKECFPKAEAVNRLE